jgi:hypothetical protein
MAKDKGKKNKASAAPAVSDSDTKIQGVIDRVVNNNKRQPNWSAFSDLVVKNGGPKIKEDHIGIVLTAYKFYQGSPEAVAVREQVSSSVEESRAARQAQREADAARRAADKKVKDDAKAARDAKAAEKEAKASKTAAAASKPKGGKAAKATPSASAGKATAKKAAAKKSSTKAAF